MVGVTLDTVEGPPGSGVSLTSSLIESFDVANFWPLTENGIVGTFDLFGNHGRRPATAVPILIAPASADSIPMASEPLNTATFFDGADEAAEIVIGVDIPYTLSTVVTFFKAASFVANQVFWSHSDTGGSAGSRGQNVGEDELFAIFKSGVGDDQYQCSLTLPDNITVNQWHMFAYRQPVDGVGVNFFYDGTFFANASAEVTNLLFGAGTVDFSFTAGNALADRFAIGSQAEDIFSGKLTGSIFHIVVDDKLWTDAQLINLWTLALSNGLNA